jgi:holo-[acyl-carrier protein] synthase
MLAGLGIDILEVARMERELSRPDHGMRDAVFTADEVRASEREADGARYLASCFTTKEAVLKALGTGYTGGVSWREIEVTPRRGRAKVELTGRVLEVAERLGVQSVLASTSHSARHAMSSVVLETQDASRHTTGAT